MSSFALALVLTAAVCHAGWNFALKKAHGDGLSFFALVGIFEILVWIVPVALLLPPLDQFNTDWLIAMFGSAVIHVAYFWLLLRAYKSADLSLAYPLARATGPLLSVLAAIFFLGEAPSTSALIGASLIISGSIWIGLSGSKSTHLGPAQLKGIGFALLCGLMIALYTVWDQQSVTVIGVPVMLFYWGTIVMRVMVSLPALWFRREHVRTWARQDLGVLLMVAVLSPAAYMLVLWAMTLAPLSMVAPAREISILLGVIAGAKLLQEGQVLSRLAASALMVGGIVMLGWA
ncbi:MAG: EamA family transporter [Burkholderiaceae bacterium]|nr:EamA family transporter [Burkholderiaceae bacterium]